MKVINSDFSELEGTNCYCSPESALAIRDSISALPLQAMHLIGTGDYHYITLFWLEKIREPFRLVLFDNHPDDQGGAFSDDIISCGGWVAMAREQPMLKQCIWVKDEKDATILSSLSSDSGLPVYISVDLDVLSTEFARTDWNQGEMSLDCLSAMIAELRDHHRIIGVDICGGLTKEKGASSADLVLNKSTEETLYNLFF